MEDRLPKFERPPLVEVVCGISVKPLGNLLVPHFGLFWERVRKEFPITQEQPPLTIVQERMVGGPLTVPQIMFEALPLPRVWFIDQPGNGIIQLQRDAFLYNWRKLNEGDAYPSFGNVFGTFDHHVRDFSDFVRELNLGDIMPVQYELTYVNHIYLDEDWSKGLTPEQMVPDLGWRRESSRFLKAYEATNCKFAFRFPNDAGRLHLSVHTANRAPDNRPLMVMELRARGIGIHAKLEQMREWFELAHEWIVRGFTDCTSLEIQKKQWGRTI